MRERGAPKKKIFNFIFEFIPSIHRHPQFQNFFYKFRYLLLFQRIQICARHSQSLSGSHCKSFPGQWIKKRGVWRGGGGGKFLKLYVTKWVSHKRPQNLCGGLYSPPPHPLLPPIVEEKTKVGNQTMMSGKLKSPSHNIPRSPPPTPPPPLFFL